MSRHTRFVGAWVGLLLIAYLLRLHHLDFESFWVDEALVAHDLEFPGTYRLGAVTHITQNGPFYWLVLRLWSEATGQSEYALRYLSVAFSLLTIPLCFALATRAFGRRAAWVAAILVAGSSYLIYYAQEARMYAFFGAIATLSTYLLLRACDHRGRGHWVLYGASALLTVESHIFGALAVLTQVVYLAFRVTALSRKARLITFGLVLLIGLPVLALRGYLLASLLATLADVPPRIPESGPNLLLMLLWVWSGFPPTLPKEVGGGAALLLTAGAIAAVSLRPGETRRRLLFAGAFLVLPIGLRLVLASALPVLHEERYLFFALPAFLVILGAGVAAGPGNRVWLACAVLLTTAWTLLPWGQGHVLGARFKENWREGVRRATAALEPGDLALTRDSGGLLWAVAYYSRKPLQFLWADAVLDNPSPTDISGLLGAYVDSGKQLLAVSSYNGSIPPEVEEWLDRRALKVEEVQRGSLALVRYRMEPYPLFDPPPMQRPVSLRFQHNVSLLGYDVAESPEDQTSLRLNLHWQARGPITGEYNASLRLVDAAGWVWASSVQPPARGFYPMASWRPGQMLRDERSLPLEPGTPPGTYSLEMTLHRQPSGEALSLVNEQNAPVAAVARLGEIDLAPRWLGATPPPGSVALDARTTGGPRLVGARLPATPLRPGEKLSLVTYWQLEGGGPLPADLALDLQGPKGDSHSLRLQGSPGDHAGTEGTSGELRARAAAGLLPATLAGGGYGVSLRLLNSAGEPLPLRQGWFPWARRSLLLGAIQVLDPPPAASLPREAVPFDAAWSEDIRLRGLLVESATTAGAGTAGFPTGSRRLDVQLYWAADDTPSRSYTVFVHLLDSAGKLVAQHDGRPAGGDAPTSGWLPGRLVRDLHPLVVPPDIPPGPYRVVVGLYAPETGRRLPRPGGEDYLQVAELQLP